MPQFSTIHVHYGLNGEISVTIAPQEEPNQYKFTTTVMGSTTYVERIITCNSAHELLANAQELASTVIV